MLLGSLWAFGWMLKKNTAKNTSFDKLKLLFVSNLSLVLISL